MASFNHSIYTKPLVIGLNSQPHGLGEVPKAQIHFISYKGAAGSEAFEANEEFGMGFTDGVLSRSHAVSSQDNVAASSAIRRIQEVPLTVIGWGGSVRVVAAFDSWGPVNTVLNWSTIGATNNADDRVHALSIGGNEVQAGVLGFTTPLGAGNIHLNFGFQPEVVVLMWSGAVSAALPASPTTGAFGLGAAGPDGQWAFHVNAQHAINPANTKRGQVTNACVYAFDNAGGIIFRASHNGMDATGVNLNFTVPGAAAYHVSALALAGISASVGSFHKSVAAAPVQQSITNPGFPPRLVLLCGVQNITAAAPVDHSRFGIGAFDGVDQGCCAFTDTDAVSPTQVDGVDKASQIYVKADNNTPAVDAQATRVSIDPLGWTHEWNINDAVMTEILYLALGDAPADVHGEDIHRSVLEQPWSPVYAAPAIDDSAIARASYFGPHAREFTLGRKEDKTVILRR